MKDFIIKKGYSIDLIVKEDDHKLIEVSKIFIKKLEEEYEKYKERLKIEQNEYEEYLNNSKVHFSQEKLLKKSPLAIINGPWGSGKTYFIEQFAKNFINNKIKVNKFEKIIILDTWKYSNSENIPDEIISELFSIICEKNKNKEELKEKLGKFAINVFNSTAISWINYYAKTDIPKLKIKERKELEKLIENISKDIDKTIIIFDNIERIGKYSWEIIKTIFKLSQINSFCFVLPMNINKLQNNESYKNDEYPIEKYVDLPIFNFKQDYLSFLRKNEINDQEAKIINNILNHEINGEKLSIREVEQRLNKNNIFAQKNYFLKINKIVNNIWNSKEKAAKELKNNEEINNFIYSLIDLNEVFMDFKKHFIESKKIYGSMNQNLAQLFVLFSRNNWNNAPDYSIWLEKFDRVLMGISQWNGKMSIKYNEKIKQIEELKREIEENKINIKKIDEDINFENNIGENIKNKNKISRYIKEYKQEEEKLDINNSKMKNYEEEIKEIKKNKNIAKKQENELNFIIDRYKMIIDEIDKETNDYLKLKYLKYEEKENIDFNNFEIIKEKIINELLI